MGIGNVMAMAISMMTEEDFWDRFNKKHNPQFYEKLKKKKTQKKKTSSAKSTKRHPVFKVSD
jgi:cytochrome b subunit of formate dehydrogenase